MQKHGPKCLSMKEDRKSSEAEAWVYKILDWLHDFFLICICIYLFIYLSFCLFDARQFLTKHICGRNNNAEQRKRRSA